jgi:hypothetical protein
MKIAKEIKVVDKDKKFLMLDDISNEDFVFFEPQSHACGNYV